MFAFSSAFDLAVLGLDGVRCLGLGAVLAGVGLICKPRAVGEALGALHRADADALDGEAGEIVDTWLRAGGGTAPGSRWLRSYLVFVGGLSLLGVGVAALAGAWS